MQMAVNSNNALRFERRLRFRNRKCHCGVRSEVIISNSRDNSFRLFFRCRTKNCKYFEWWSLDANNPHLEEEMEGITSNARGHDGLSSNVGEGDVCREANEVEVVLEGVRGLRTIVLMLFVIFINPYY